MPDPDATDRDAPASPIRTSPAYEAWLTGLALRLLQDEYPDDMARRSCTCDEEHQCGAHRLLARYEALYLHLREVNVDRRRLRAELASIRRTSMPDSSSGEYARDERGLLLPGTPVGWHQRGTGERKSGKIVWGYHGMYGPTYHCRADIWSYRWGTKVVEADLTHIGGDVEPLYQEDKHA